MMRWRLLCLLVAIGCSWMVMAQQDTVLARINGEQVSYSDFRNACNNYGMQYGLRHGSLQDRLEAFIIFRLKYQEAERERIDTLSTVCKAVETYRRQLLKGGIIDSVILNRSFRREYDCLAAQYRSGRVLVSHIYKSLPQNISSHTVFQSQSKMDSIYRALCAGASFNQVLHTYSEAKDTFWLSALQMPIEFEDIAFNLQSGTFSRPFFTPQGLHIVKVLKQESLPSFEVWKKQRLKSNEDVKIGQSEIEEIVNHWKEQLSYQPNEVVMHRLKTGADSGQTLFTLHGKSYTVADFKSFSQAHPAGISRCLHGFIVKSVLDAAVCYWLDLHSDAISRLQAYREQLMVQELTNNKLKQAKLVGDSVLQDYFLKHRKDYYWTEPRFRGVVIHAKSKRAARQAHRFLKGIPSSEWEKAVQVTFSAEQSDVQAEIGLFAPGDNAYVDCKVFKKRNEVKNESYPFTQFCGRKEKGPIHYQEVCKQVQNSYIRDWKARWIAQLQVSSKVEINEEVLKTVNYH